MSSIEQTSFDPTEKTLYTEPHSDHWGTSKDRLFQIGNGIRKDFGIEVSGAVYVLPLKKWHELAEQQSLDRKLIEELISYLEMVQKIFKDFGIAFKEGENPILDAIAKARKRLEEK